MPAPLNLAPVRALCELRLSSSSDRPTAYRRSAANPFRITSFADPHPLNPIESHLYINHGGGGPLVQNLPVSLYFITTLLLFFSTLKGYLHV